MHPQRTEYDIRPHSELLDTAADWHTMVREDLSEIFGEARAGRWSSLAIVAGVAVVGLATVVGVLSLLGWAVGAGLGWAFGHLAAAGVTVWDQVLHPALAAPIDAWFAAHTGGFGWDPRVVLAVWGGLGALLWLSASLRNRAGIAMFAAWLGWAGATTAIVHAGAAAADSVLSAGIAAAAALVLSIVPILQLPPSPAVPVVTHQDWLRDQLAEQDAALSAARASEDHETARRVRHKLRDTLAELYPEPKPLRSHAHVRAEDHQDQREFHAVALVIAAAVAGGGVLLFGMSGSAEFAVIAGGAALALAVLVALPSKDQVYARRLERERERERRQADEAVLAEAARTLRSVTLWPHGGDPERPRDE